MTEPIIGIDLGTTNSAVAIIENGTPKIIPIEDQSTMPSCVGLDGQGHLLVGQTALNQLAANPESTVTSIKRQMGKNTTVRLGDRSFSPEEISALILGKLKSAAEDYLKQAVNKAVITVPAYFDEGQRKATTDAAKLAKLEAVRIINEPTAAALAYDAESASNQTLLVYDLGGGTFDVSVVVVEEGVVEVKASHGDTELGGDDFDEELVQHVGTQFKNTHGLEIGDDLKAKRRLKVALERAKCTLSDQPYVKIDEDFLYEGKHLTSEISRELYEQRIASYLEKTLGCMHQAMKDAGITPQQLDKILLVGGSSRTPAVSNLIESTLEIEPSLEVNPDLIVALGAAVQAGTLAGVESQSILVDITPHTFNTSTLNSSFIGPHLICVPIIKRNTPLPCRKAEVFYTVSDRQEQVTVDVSQGESSIPEENTTIGEFVVAGLSPVPSGNPIIIEFALDLNGMLKVTATEKSTGLSKEVAIDTTKQTRTFDLEEARENIAAISGETILSDENAPIDAENDHQAILTESKSLKKRAEALDSSGLDAADVDEIQDLVKRTRSAILEQDWEKVHGLNQNLSDVLFYLED